MNYEKYNKQKLTSSTYHLTPQQLEEIHRKYGRPGEISPGRPAKKKRGRLDAALAAMDRKDQHVFHIEEDNETDLDINFNFRKNYQDTE
ncbi:hypothetical protein [Desulfolucanica intricata]|uniref:hypothetical protein n=1 Tax=Desulfolucanica intricata TaxID=1285191 RepID=UPI00083689F2|nr:hypothetical protein [Desulfolucanica intricata]